MEVNTCGHFSTEVELITLQHTPVVLRVPVRRCSLAEQMIAILSQSDEGREVAGKIQMLESSSAETRGGPPRYRAAFGPDLEAISRGECTPQRCKESCSPGYRQVLSYFGYVEESGRETGQGCLELA